MDIEKKIGEEIIFGKLLSLDDEKIEELEKISRLLKQVETSIKENIISKFSKRR